MPLHVAVQRFCRRMRPVRTTHCAPHRIVAVRTVRVIVVVTVRIRCHSRSGAGRQDRPTARADARWCDGLDRALMSGVELMARVLFGCEREQALSLTPRTASDAVVVWCLRLRPVSTASGR